MRISKRLPAASFQLKSAIWTFYWLLSFLLSALPSWGSGMWPNIERIYLKNNSPYQAYVWVDDRYQGQVAPGEVCYAYKDGDTSNGGLYNPAGGWPPFGHWLPLNDADRIRQDVVDRLPLVQVSLQTTEGTWISVSIVPTVNKDHFSYVWFGDKSAGKRPEAKDWLDHRINYFSKPELRKEDCVSTVAAYAATEPDLIGAWQASITEKVNAKFRAGDYKGARSYLLKVEEKWGINDGLCNHYFVDKMISQLDDFINKKH